MNSRRRNALLILAKEIATTISKIQTILDEEQECLDNIPENLQSSDMYCKCENNCNLLEACIELCEEVLMNIDDTIS